MATPLLIQNLQNAKLYDHPVKKFSVIETHISWVILTGHSAYKIKKPVDFQFLDFSSLEKRHHFCQKELRLNQTLAPQIYQGVVAITGSEEKPEINGPGPVIEYALKMREFSQDSMLNKVLERGELSSQIIDELAQQLATFHQQAKPAAENTYFGTPVQVIAPVIQNFDQIRPLLRDPNDLIQLDHLQAWATKEYSRLISVFQQRKQQAHIRECHGDVHLGNIILLDEHPVIFDCIEFNEEFRWTDTMADLGFLAMDLKDHRHINYAYRLINSYMEHSGDYTGLYVLRFYMAYRAMVRAKISLFRLHQPGILTQEQQAVYNKYRSCTKLAESYTQPTKPALILTHGFAGSGKSTIAKFIVECLGAIQIRSDVVRKRLFGLALTARSHSALNSNIYTEAATDNTHQQMLELAQQLINVGYPVILDARFLKTKYRHAAHELARQLQIPFAIIHCQATDDELKKRITKRLDEAKDPSEANHQLLESQQTTNEPLSAEEQSLTVSVNTQAMQDKETFIIDLRKVLVENKKAPMGSFNQ